MIVSDKGMDFLKEHEGCSSKIKGKNVLLNIKDIACNILVYPYLCPANVLTIGWGCRVKDEKGNLIYGTDFENGIQVLECEKMFVDKINNEYSKYVNNWLKKEVNQNQFDALVCFCYNTPVGAKNIIQLINNNTPDSEIMDNWLKFCTIKGTVNKGLLNRRQKELKLFYA